MIRIACTNCKTVLSIDDAFAGGVCRCQHCGTIQTVPAQAKAGAAVGGQGLGGSKAIYQSGSRSAEPGTGLDDLAGAVASSGLTGSGLTSRRLTRPVAGNAAVATKKSMMPVVIGVGTVIIVLVAVIIWLATKGSGGAGGNASQNTVSTENTGPVTPPVVANTPNFCGIKIDAPSVVYVLDRGMGTREVFGALKDAAIKSASTLGTDRKFEIVFWSNGEDVVAYPDASTTYAMKDNIAAAQRSIDDVSAYGASDIVPALKKALAHDPGVLVIATAKDYLDDAWVNDVLAARGSSSVKIDTVNLGASPSVALKAIASKTGGEYRDVSHADLGAYSGK